VDALGRLLLVDDEPAIRLFLSEELAQAGYAVHTAASGEEALASIQKENFDLVLLDLKMGGMNGLRALEMIERMPSPPVVIILTAYASVDSAISVLRHGGYDFLLKPCRTEELLASVEKGLAKRRQALLREKAIGLIEETARQLRDAQAPSTAAPATPPRFLEGRGLLLDYENETVTRDGQPVALTPAEFRLLVCLMEHADQPVRFGQLAAALHGHSDERQSDRQAITTHLWRLGRKVGHARDGHPFIVNVRGKGYQFVGKTRGNPNREILS
jgi:DNA-binding response OmpR family regulator